MEKIFISTYALLEVNQLLNFCVALYIHYLIFFHLENDIVLGLLYVRLLLRLLCTQLAAIKPAIGCLPSVWFSNGSWYDNRLNFRAYSTNILVQTFLLSLRFYMVILPIRIRAPIFMLVASRYIIVQRCTLNLIPEDTKTTLFSQIIVFSLCLCIERVWAVHKISIHTATNNFIPNTLVPNTIVHKYYCILRKVQVKCLFLK